MRLLLAANNQATRRNEIIKSYLQLGSSSNRYAPRLPQQETKSSTKQLAPTDPILGPENLLKTGFAQKGLPSRVLGISYQHLNIWSIFLAISQKANTWCLQQTRTKPDCALTNLAFRFCAAFMCALVALKA